MVGYDVYLVGDRFSEFATHPGVQTIGRFIETVRSGTLLDGPARLLPGQGVTETEWSQVVDELASANLLDRVAASATPLTPVPNLLVHKAHEANVLLANLREVSAGRFASDLRLHADNELLNDHITGQHVPGMVIIEAARQMMMAVSNAYYLPMLTDADHGYVLNSIECRFDRYVFPLSAVVELTMDSAEETRPKRMKFEASVTIRQAGMVAATCSAKYFAYENAALARYEHALADRATAAEREKVDRVVPMSKMVLRPADIVASNVAIPAPRSN